MSSTASVSQWISLLKSGDATVAQVLWEHYFERLVGLARKKLRRARRRATDQEDVALSAFDSFCRGAMQGRFPQLRDRHNLWPLLVLITARKALDHMQHERRLKRGGGAVRGESALQGPESSSPPGLDRVIGKEPTSEFAVQVSEECERLLQRLGDPALRSVAIWKMEGYTNAEIAAKLGCVEGTVERKLRVIRTIWEKEGDQC
jgi:DNA-directed RNA polymerase specialized sigma24 family protein